MKKEMTLLQAMERVVARSRTSPVAILSIPFFMAAVTTCWRCCQVIVTTNGWIAANKRRSVS